MISPTVKKRFVWNSEEWPEPGDFLKNVNTGNVWMVEEIIPCKPESDMDFVAVCTRLEKDAVDDYADGVHWFEPLRR